MREEIRRWLDGQFAGDASAIDLVWNEYLVETSSKLEQARAASEANDYPRLDRLAHALKGNALVVGDLVLSEAAVALRDAAKGANASGVRQALERLETLSADYRQ